jgi:hypothetical protein
MLVGPLWILAFVDGMVKRLAIITGFIAFFFVLAAIAINAAATNAGLLNALATAAAYSGVFMVFLQVVAV